MLFLLLLLTLVFIIIVVDLDVANVLIVIVLVLLARKFQDLVSFERKHADIFRLQVVGKSPVNMRKHGLTNVVFELPNGQPKPNLNDIDTALFPKLRSTRRIS